MRKRFNLSLFKRLKTDQQASLLIEFALSLPFFLGFLAGIAEVGNFLLLNLKLQHSAVAMADLITRDDTISEATITDIFAATPQILRPFEDPDLRQITISAVSQLKSEPARVFWQRTSGNLDTQSPIGAEGDSPNLPDDFILRDNETIIITEIFYIYRPFIFTIIPEKTLYRAAYFRPRIGSLQNIS